MREFVRILVALGFLALMEWRTEQRRESDDAGRRKNFQVHAMLVAHEAKK